jgi:predicted TIM-barrel fold metal-dependent hydrolase
MAARLAKLDDLGVGRLADMDAAGIDLQVISHNVGTLESLDSPQAVSFARQSNDELAEAVAAHPDRFAGFASLPTIDPRAAAQELERAVGELGFKGALVNGHIRGRFLDHPDFWPIFEAAEGLSVPIYLHPTEPPAPVRAAYYEGLSPEASQMLATAGWGWHIETGLHSLRLILGGVFDRFDGLSMIIGHMGEAVPFMLARSARQLNAAARLPHGVEEYFDRHFHVTTSGLFTLPPMLCLLLVVGADRIIFSVDYPFSSNEDGKAFLDQLPVSPADKEKIAHGNVDRLLRLDERPKPPPPPPPDFHPGRPRPIEGVGTSTAG